MVYYVSQVYTIYVIENKFRFENFDNIESHVETLLFRYFAFQFIIRFFATFGWR